MKNETLITLQQQLTFKRLCALRRKVQMKLACSDASSVFSWAGIFLTYARLMASWATYCPSRASREAVFA